MGIKNLNKLLRDKCPEAFVPKHLSEYAYKKLAIDISLYLNKYKKFTENWLVAFISLVVSLRRNDVSFVFIYDGPNAPVEKSVERDKRYASLDTQKTKIFNLETSLNNYHYSDGKVIDEYLKEYWITNREKLEYTPLLMKRKLDPDNDKPNIEAIEAHVKKLIQSASNITEEDIGLTKELFDILSVPYIQASAEAEALCAYLCKRGDIDGIITEDTDVLAYGAPLFLPNINTYRDTIVEVKYEDVLEGLELSSESFRDMCIMCGTDYNSNIPKIGPMNAYKHIKANESIENLEAIGMNVSILNHTRVRKIFESCQVQEGENHEVLHCGFPNEVKLHNFIMTNSLQYNVGTIMKAFSPKKIVFE